MRQGAGFVLKDYLAGALRACRRAPWATAASVFTLALGLACFVVAYSIGDYLGPNVAIERRFAEDYFNESYASFSRINEAFTAFALVAVAIAAIGVRKILGGSTRQMTFMPLAAFGWPVVVANLVAWPLAYIAPRAYLDIFIDPIELSALPFVGCLIVTLSVAGLAVAQQTLRAARLKPATVLRHE